MPTTRSRWSSDPRTVFWVVAAVAFALRLVHILGISDPALNPSFVAPVTDAGVHHRWARGLLDGSWPGAAPFFRAPLYPYFLGALYAVWGPESPLPVQLVHGAVSALGAALAAMCALRLWDHRAAWAAGLLLAAAWSSIYFSGELLGVTLAVTLNLLLLWLALGPPSAVRLGWTGAVLGLAALARPTVLVVLPVLAWAAWRRGAFSARRAGLPGWAWLGLGTALLVAPVTIRNLVRGGEPVLIAASGGVNFHIGNNPWSDGRVAFLPGAPPSWQGEMADAVALASEQEGRPLTALGADRHFWAQGLRFWREDPGAALTLTARKLWLLVAAGERSNNKNLAFWRSRSPLLRWPVWPGWAALLGLAVLGLARRDLDPVARRLLLGLLLVYGAAVVLFFVNARFRLPLLAWLAVPAGGGLAALLAGLRDRRHWPWRPAWIGVAVAVVTAVTVPDALTYHQDPATDFESWRALGNTYLQVGDEDRALAAWESALAADAAAPRDAHRWTLPLVYRPLADLHGQLGRPDRALATYQRWVERLPDDDTARLGLANLLLAEGRAGAARRELELVAARSPQNTEAQLGLGWALQHSAEPASALPHFEAAAAGGAGPSAELGLGLCLVALERWDEAEPRLEAVLERQPDLWQAREALAEVYRATGRPAAERAAWERVLRDRPQHRQARERLAVLGR